MQRYGRFSGATGMRQRNMKMLATASVSNVTDPKTAKFVSTSNGELFTTFPVAGSIDSNSPQSLWSSAPSTTTCRHDSPASTTVARSGVWYRGWTAANPTGASRSWAIAYRSRGPTNRLPFSAPNTDVMMITDATIAPTGPSSA